MELTAETAVNEVSNSKIDSKAVTQVQCGTLN